MKDLKHSKLTFEDGKQTKEEVLVESKPIMDSVADNLVIDSEQAIKKAKESKGIKIIEVWEEVENPKRKKSDENEFDVQTATKPKLIAYAEENEIDLGDAKKVDEIRAAIIEAEKPKE